MRITNNTVSDNILRQIQNIGTQQSKLQTQVATGQRIFQPEDDPTAMGRVLDLESERRQIAQYMRNADRAMEVSQATFAGLQQLKKVSDRATEVGTLGAGTLGADAARAYASEVDQLIEQALQAANLKFRNDHLFAGNAVDAPPFTATRVAGQITAVAYVGTGEPAEIPVSESARVNPGSDSTTNNGIQTFLTNLIALRDALNAGDSAAVSAAKESLITDEDVIVSSLAEHGGIQARIEVNRAQQVTRSDDVEKLVSKETDTDLPTAIVRLNQSQTAYQAALQSAASIMRISLLDYIQ